ncbi:histone acetyltransferase catalytic subunit HAT1 [Sporobolomyces salmoneus]|uniref:histone acetyltransferase catalytic subunit HAT1 n=1 Tax=Sporobolomyces salmoneus TaxID=183962 RepID=UPI00316E983D
MATQDWSCDGLSALQLRLCRSKEDTASLQEGDQALVGQFSPTFVYPIFGEEETIFGYQGLSIDYRFTSGSLNQYLSISYTSKFPSTSSVVQADDPEKTLYEFIPPSYSKSLEEFEKIIEKDSQEFKPVGELIGRYRMSRTDLKGKGKGTTSSGLPKRNWETLPLNEPEKEGEEEEEEEVEYEAYWTNWETKGFKEFHRKAQIFVLLYIEGAQYIDEEDQRWEFVTLFEKRKRRGDGGEGYSYHFMGYVSFYSFFCWPDTKRLRLAQFVLLPPYHGKGHGSALYDLCYQNLLKRTDISELTVEDPSETFEDMRDKCDLYTLISGGDLNDLKILPKLDRGLTESIRKKYKLADRQFYRLVEMILLLQLCSSSSSSTKDPAVEKAFRLIIKKRLYLFNKEQLLQIEDPEERKEKLQETFESVVEDYKRLTEKFSLG